MVRPAGCSWTSAVAALTCLQVGPEPKCLLAALRISGSDIKDKAQLLEARKAVERQMERFKVCEKETKTKAFSKEGLGQAAKLDPREKKRIELQDWISDRISKLNEDVCSQLSTLSAQLQELSAVSVNGHGLSGAESFVLCMLPHTCLPGDTWLSGTPQQEHLSSACNQYLGACASSRICSCPVLPALSI